MADRAGVAASSTSSERLRASVGGAWRWGAANLALVVTVVVGGGLVLAANALAGEVYEAVVERDGLAGLDEPVLEAAVASRTPTSEELVTHFTDVGGTVGMPIIALVVTAVLAVARRSWLPVVLMLVATTGSVLLTVLGQGPRRTSPPAGRPGRPASRDLPGVPVRACAQRDGRARCGGLPRRARSPSPAQQGARGLRGRRLRARHGPLAGLARAPLAHRRHGRLAHRPRLARHGRHGTPGQGDPRPEGTGRDAAGPRPGPQPPRASTARPASSRATGTRNGEHET